MALPGETAQWLIYSGREVNVDFVCINENGVITLHWYHADPEPTEQEIIDGVASPAFIAWQEENGGDPVKTGRRRKRELLDSDMGKVLLAVVEGLVNEINTLRAEHSLPPRTEQQVRDYVVNAINNGERD